jgi:hydroxyacylglutathione hydrolase
MSNSSRSSPHPKDSVAVSSTPANNSSFNLGSIKITALYTPCHTQDSISWFFEDPNSTTGPKKAVFTGDTLFHGGCGRFFEGSAAEMHRALNITLGSLPDDTAVYPGHEYTASNVKFAKSVSTSEGVRNLEAFCQANKETAGKFTIADEKRHNVFMMLDDPEIQKRTGETQSVAVMKKLRHMKDNFS